MSRKERARAARQDRFEVLLSQGAHRSADQAAREVLMAAGASEEERTAAAEVLRSLRPEPGAVVAGAVGVVLALAVTLWTVLRG